VSAFVTAPERKSGQEPSDRPTRTPWPWIGLASLVLGTVAVNLWWIAAYRRGLPFDIDEAGYLQRAVREADALHGGGLSRLVSTVRQPDPQAPLLTSIAGVIRWATGAGPYRLLAVQQGFYVVVVGATYWGARRLTNRRWSLVGAVVVATLPGLVASSRQFVFAVPAAAMLTAMVAAQLHADDYSSLPMSVLWGGFLGLTTLSRTVVLALLPPLVLGAVLRVAVSRPRPRQVLNLGAGLAVGLLIGASWYSVTWRQVFDYLNSYGYGAPASHYGTGHSVLSLGWWTFRLHNVVDTVVLVPLALVLAGCFVASAIGLMQQLRAGPAAGPRRRLHLSLADATGRFLAGPHAVLWFAVIGGYLVLSSTRDVGSWFELPPLPAAVMLAISGASHTAPRVRPYLATGCITAAALSFAGVSGVLPSTSTSAVRVAVGGTTWTVFDGRGSLLGYANGTGGGCRAGGPCDPSRTAPGETAYLRQWLPPSQHMATRLHDFATQRGFEPVVFFAVQDPFFNTNTVDLAYQMGFAQSLPTGLLQTGEKATVSVLAQLEDPAQGRPNLVITGPEPAVPAARNFSPLTADAYAAIPTLEADGFKPAAGIPLPDSRVMTVWWKARGPRAVPSS
jgi:4-amino-4-deoxy-L-arabinose transferase-like glycosyltransferase